MYIDVYRQAMFLGFKIDALQCIAMLTQNLVTEIFMMCSRGQILLEIHDAIAMVTQNWVGKIHDVFKR